MNREKNYKEILNQDFSSGELRTQPFDCVYKNFPSSEK